MTSLIRKYLNDTSGATAIEYGLIAALIGVAMIAGASALGDKLNSQYDCLGHVVEHDKRGSYEKCMASSG